jgi:hypothetical protein
LRTAPERPEFSLKSGVLAFDRLRARPYTAAPRRRAKHLAGGDISVRKYNFVSEMAL